MNARKVLLATAAFLAFSTSASAYWYPAPPPYPRYYYYPYAYPIYAPPRYYVVPGYRYFYTPVLPVRPIVVERYYPAVPPPPKYTYEERSYAQVTPAPKPERPAPPPASRLERQTLSARELFAFDKADLRKPQPKLDEIASVLVRNPQIGNVTITGYTDRIGSDAYNKALSQRRANAVKSYLVGKGVPASRLTAVGKGESNPVVECHDKDRQALIKCLEPNRRVEVEQITVERRY